MSKAKAKVNSKKLVIKAVPITEARNTFFEIVRKTHHQRKVFRIEKSGIPVAFIIPADIEEIFKAPNLRK